MKVEIRGRNHSVLRVVHDLIRELKNLGLTYVYTYSGGRHAQSNACAYFYVDGAQGDLCKFLEDNSVHIEAVEETPGVIFRYISPLGEKRFKSSIDTQEIDTSFYDYEDEEAYCERMGKVGILV